MPIQNYKYRRGHPLVLLISTILALLLASTPMSIPAFAEWKHNLKVNSIEYKQTYGFWETLKLPKEFQINSIHAAALPTGKILLVAGSGNNRDSFNAYTNQGEIKVLKSALYDPETMKVKLISTPSDLFCSGHAVLQSGNLLIAGGTSGYELLKENVTKPAGALIIHDENPHSTSRVLKKGTKFTNSSGKVYESTQEVIVKPAVKMDHGNGNVMIMHSSTKVFVEAVAADTSYVTSQNEHFTIEGMVGEDVHDIYAQGGPMTLNKQDFRGDNKALNLLILQVKYMNRRKK